MTLHDRETTYSFQRVVRRTPIEDFQLGPHLEDYKREQQLTTAEVDAMLQAGPIWFAVADVGHELRLIELDQCVKFWKLDGKPHVAENSGRLEYFPDEYLYFASHWVAKGARPIILLEKHH